LFFAQTCSFCHGNDARGGAEGGPDLTQSAIVRGDVTGAQLGQFLQVGRPDKKMPPFPLASEQLADVTAFLRSAIASGGRGVAAIVVGDAKAGESYFNGAGKCTACHSTTGNLKGIGLKYSTAQLQGRIVLPRGAGSYPRNGSEIAPYRSVTVTLPSGDKHSGTLLAVSLFAVTLRDGSGVTRTFSRTGDVPQVDIVDPLQAHLDLMKTLTDADMHNLTAFLVTLR
jgi:cytochrome c oxidase cbb3-type subunit 3